MTLMLKVIVMYEETQESSYLQRKCFELLNHLSVKVNLKEKETVGDLGAISVCPCQFVFDVVEN